MPKTLTSSDFMILGYTSAEAIEDQSAWTIFSAHATAGLRDFTDTFLYIKASASDNDENLALQRLKSKDEINVIVPKSREHRIKAIQKKLGYNSNAYVYEDLIWQKLESTFEEYLTSLRNGIPRPDPFVTPHEENDSKENVLRSVRDILTKGEEGSRKLLAVLAPAGVGKTTLSRALTARLADNAKRNRMIPVYVEASHWRQAQLTLERTDDLWDVVSNSLTHFSPDIRLTRTLYDHLLKTGDIAFIFDGFDELCTDRYSPFSPREVARQLADISAESGARIMLTTRTAFWESEVGSDLPNVEVKTLTQFTKQQAHKYLEDRFSNAKDTFRRAQDLLAKVRAENQPTTPGGGKGQITYHPYVVELIGTVAETNADTGVEVGKTTLGGSENVLLDILASMCEREQLRQELRSSALEQMGALQELAMEQLSTGEPYFPVDLVATAGINEEDLGKLKSHPLFNRSVEPEGKKDEVYEFRYEFMPYLFGAKGVIDKCRDLECVARPAVDDQFLKLMERFREGSSQLFDHIGTNWPDSLPVSVIRKVFLSVPESRRNISRFLIHVCKAIATKWECDRRERTELILGTLNLKKEGDASEIENLWLQGTLDKMDLRGTQFYKCVFQDVVFQSCVVDYATEFRRCKFSGVFQVVGRDRKSWRDIKITEIAEIDSTARVSLEELQKGGSGNRAEFLADVLELALRKFWRHGHLKRHLRKEDWNTGVLGEMEIANDVLAVLRRVGLVEEIPAAGGRQASYEFNVDALGDLQRFMDSRQRTGRVMQAYTELEKL